MDNLTRYDNREIEHFNNDEAQISQYPNKGCVFIFKHEQYTGEFAAFSKFWIIHINDKGFELERFNALSNTVSRIIWA